MKILILKPSSLGDVVQALPVLRLLKQHDPAHEIYWWLSTDLLPLLEGDPDLAGILPFDRRRWAWPNRWGSLVRSVRQMRTHAFDRVIDLQGLARSGIFAWLARGKLTVGLDDSREGAGAFYDVVVPRPSFHTHAVEWYLKVLDVLEVPVHWEFTWLPLRKEVAASIQSKWIPSAGRWLIVIPGARWPNKRWPAPFFGEFVRQITTAHADIRIAILGSLEDQPLGATISEANRERCLDLTGKTSLPEMIEWIRFGDLMVTNDSGPMHVAAAMGKPVVALFGPTEPRRTGPYRQISDALRVPLPCAPCLKSTCANSRPLECLEKISPSDVLAHVERRLSS